MFIYVDMHACIYVYKYTYMSVCGNHLQVHAYINALIQGLHNGSFSHISTTFTQYGLDACNVGDEGGFAPNIPSAEEGLDLLVEAISKAGYSGAIKIGMDCAASEVCVCVCVCVCIYIYVCMYVCIYIHMYVCMYVCMFVCIYVCMYVCMYVCLSFSICPSLYLSLCLSMSLSVSLCLYAYRCEKV